MEKPDFFSDNKFENQETYSTASVANENGEIIKCLREFVYSFVRIFEEKRELYKNESAVGGIPKTTHLSNNLSKPFGTIFGGGSAIISGIPVAQGLGARFGEEAVKLLSVKLTDHREKAKKVIEVLRELEQNDFRKILVLVAGDVFWCFQNQFINVTDINGSSARAMEKLATDSVNRATNYIDKQENKYFNFNKKQEEEFYELITKGIVFGKSKMRLSSIIINLFNINKLVNINIIPDCIKKIIPKSGHTIKSKDGDTWSTSSLFENVGKIKINKNKDCEFYNKSNQFDSIKYGYRLPFKWETFEEYERMNPNKQSVIFCYNFPLAKDELNKNLKIILCDINNEDLLFNSQNTKEGTTNILQILKEEVVVELNNVKINKANIDENIKKIDNKINTIEVKIDKLIPKIGGSNKKSVWFDMREPVKTFTGRSDVLLKLHETLQSEKGRAVVSQAASVSGLGGIGKSELARKYGFDFSKYYDDNVLWINAETKENLKESFFRLANKLKIPITIKEEDYPEKERDIEFIVEDIYQLFENGESLFIFDNAEDYRDINEFLPKSFSPQDKKPHILITSRNQNWDIRDEGTVEVIKLIEFSVKEAIDYIKTALALECNITDNDNIKSLAEELQYFPLALGQATAYINVRNKELNMIGDQIFEINDYQKEYKSEENKSKLLDFKSDLGNNRYNKTVLTTWNVTLKKIEKNIDALNIIQIMSYLAPDSINNKEIFLDLVKDELKLQKSIEVLSQYSMINVKNGISNIHRLVQEVIRLQFKENGKEEEGLMKAINVLGSALHNVWIGEINYSHITSLWNYACEYNQIIEEYYFKYTYFYSKVTPLHLLAKSNNIKAVVKILEFMKIKYPIKFNEIINAKNYYHHTPIHMAVENGNIEMVETLKNLGAETDQKSHLKAIFNGYVGICKILNPNNNEYLLHAELIAAFKTGNTDNLNNFLKGFNGDKLKSIMEKKISGSSSIETSYATPLYFAASHGSLDIVKLLIHYKANINFCTKYGDTIIHIAAFHGNLEIVKFLIEKGANSKKENERGWTVLQFTAKSGHLNIIKYLLNNNIVDVNIIDEDNRSPLHIATEYGHLEIVKFFLEKGANCKAMDQFNRTILHYAARSNHLEIAKCLLENGIDINAIDKYSLTALHYATKNGYFEIVKLLLDKGANSKVIDKYGRTILHCAAKKGHLDIATYLINNNIIDASISDKDGSTPLHLAAFQGKLNVVEFLLGDKIKVKSNINATDGCGTTPIFSAMLNCNCEIVKFLLKEEGVHINTIISFPFKIHKKLKFSVFHLAIINESLEIIKKIIDTEGINIINEKIDETKNVTALHFALYYNCTDVIQYFKEIGLTFDEKCYINKGNRKPRLNSFVFYSIFDGLCSLDVTVSEILSKE